MLDLYIFHVLYTFYLGLISCWFLLKPHQRQTGKPNFSETVKLSDLKSLNVTGVLASRGMFR